MWGGGWVGGVGGSLQSVSGRGSRSMRDTCLRALHFMLTGVLLRWVLVIITTLQEYSLTSTGTLEAKPLGDEMKSLFC